MDQGVLFCIKQYFKHTVLEKLEFLEGVNILVELYEVLVACNMWKEQHVRSHGKNITSGPNQTNFFWAIDNGFRVDEITNSILCETIEKISKGGSVFTMI